MQRSISLPPIDFCFRLLRSSPVPQTTAVPKLPPCRRCGIRYGAARITVMNSQRAQQSGKLSDAQRK
jgi:hypothetical protein